MKKDDGVIDAEVSEEPPEWTPPSAIRASGRRGGARREEGRVAERVGGSSGAPLLPVEGTAREAPSERSQEGA